MPAAAGNAERLLAEGHLVMTFPEGGRGTGPGYARRYRLERLGHGGFVELALRSGAPIVPCAIVAGGPGLADRVLARVARLPRPPLPLPVPPAPARWRIAFGEPLPVAQHGPDAAEDRALVLELSERRPRARAGEGVRQPRQPRGSVVMPAEFNSPKEFREVMDRIFSMMDTDPDMGPKLRAADVPQRFEFSDVDMVVNIRAAADGEDGNLHWEWSDDVDWEPKVKMTMSSETANKYFQGKENVAIAIARRRIKTGGDVKAALALIPITKPVYAQLHRGRRDRVSAPEGLRRDV